MPVNRLVRNADSAELQRDLATTGTGVREAFDRQPTAEFPTGVAVVRVQQSGYRSQTARGYGSGAFSVVTTRDIETPEQYERLNALPQLAGIAPIGRLQLPTRFGGVEDLRRAAAELQADMLLLYTLDTQFTNDDKAKPLTVISLGLSPNKVVSVTTTASALLIDTRTGFIYGSAEATAEDDQLANAWTDENAADETRRRVEREAFGELVDELELMWGGVLQRFAPTQAASAR